MADNINLVIVGGRRGPKPRAEAKSHVRAVRLSPQELIRVNRAARANHQTVSDFLRDAAVGAAEDCLEDNS
jgi:uncharacterized protein (DUF1778 family)